MEGYLEVWQGFFSRWSKYYFRIIEDTLIFGPTKESAQWKVHLKVARISTTFQDPVSLLLYTGTETMRLRAFSIDQRVRWYKKIKNVQKRMQQTNYHKQIQQVDKQLGKNSKLKVLEQLNVELWQCHAVLENIIDELTLRLKGVLNSKDLTNKLRMTVQQIKLKNSEALKILEEEIATWKDKKINNDSIRMFDNKSIDFSADYQPYNQTKFMSFIENREGSQFSMKKKSKIFSNNGGFPNQTQFFSFEEQRTNNIKMREPSELEVYPQQKLKFMHRDSQNLVKGKIIMHNIVFKETAHHIDNSDKRQSLPVKFTPQERFSMISMFTGIGSDLTRFSFPVTTNQPLSLLEKCCEQMYYSKLLETADQQIQPELRMLYLASFVVSQYSLTQMRTKKPFNPLLGETFEYIDDDREFQFLSQQVSHHPPISAFYCRSNHYEIIDNTKSKTQFTGSAVKVVPGSKGKIILDRFKDEYKFTKCTLSMNNLLMGKVYIENFGQIIIECKKYQTKAVLKLKQQSFWNKSQTNAVEGAIWKTGEECYKIQGKWNEILKAKKVNSHQSIVSWRKIHQQNSDYYCFNDYTFQMNHLNKDTLRIIPPTDSRLRPDQRALEYQKLELAASQKHRLEEQQRRKRRQNESLKRNHQVLWFEVQIDEDGEQIYRSNGKYWQERNRGGWDMCLQIF